MQSKRRQRKVVLLGENDILILKLAQEIQSQKILFYNLHFIQKKLRRILFMKNFSKLNFCS